MDKILLAKLISLKASNSELFLAKELDKKTRELYLELIEKIESIELQHGEDGHTPTEEELLELITPLIPNVKDGKDYIITEQDKNDIVKMLSEIIEDGVDGEDGSDYILTETDLEDIAKLVKVEVPQIKEKTAEEVRDLLETLKDEERLDISAIKGLDEKLAKIKQKNVTVGTRVNPDLTSVEKIGFYLTSDTDALQGQLKWDLDHETIVMGLDGESIPINFDSDTFINQTGSTIPAGTPIYATGTLGSSGKITCAPFLNDGNTDQKYYVGITWGETINGESGVYISGTGKLRGIDTSAFPDGTVLYPSETVAGAFQTTEPTTGFILPIAFVIHSHAQNGVIAIRWTQEGGGGVAFNPSLYVDEQTDFIYYGNDGNTVSRYAVVDGTRTTATGAWANRLTLTYT